jgi:hypothetical protein
LPEGTVISLVIDDEDDDLTDQERQALHDALSASWKSAEAGHLRASVGDSRRFASASVSLPVRTTPESDEQIRRIDDWWAQQSAAAPDVFLSERGACAER